MTDVKELDDELKAKRQAVLDAMPTPGHGRAEDHIQVDFFGAADENTVTLSDGVSTITHRTLMEGEKRKYMNAVNRDLVINRKTEDARMKLAPGDDRTELLKLAIVGWNLLKDGAAFPFTPQNLNLILEKFPPKELDIVEKDIRKHNPWLLSEVTVEGIDQEIENLNELRAKKVEEEEGKARSSS